MLQNTISLQDARPGDRLGLEELVANIVDDIRLTEVVDAEGFYTDTENGGPKKHPAAAARIEVRKEIRYWLAELRMTPKSRGVSATATTPAGTRAYTPPTKPALVGGLAVDPKLAALEKAMNEKPRGEK